MESATEVEYAKRSGEENIVEETGMELEDYEDMTKGELVEKAKELEIEGYSKMDKRELIKAIKKREEE